MIERKGSDVVIIGGVAAGPKAGAVLGRRLPGATVALFQRDEYISYGSCGLPYFASGEVGRFDALTKTSYDVVRTPEFFRDIKGVDVMTLAEVTAIDRAAGTVTVRDLRDGSVFTHGYATLVIATGARPKRPPFPVDRSPLIRYFTRPEDAIDFRRLAERGKIGSLVIVGGGPIGCELAEGATVWGFETTLVEREVQLLPGGFDPEMALHARRELERNGIRVLTGAAVRGISLRDGLPVTVTDIAGELASDYVILCLGVEPETSLAASCGLELGRYGGILVDEHMRTSDPSIYAGGDCVEVVSGITGERVFLPMGSLANRHGRVIGENIAGSIGENIAGSIGENIAGSIGGSIDGTPARMPGALGTALVKVCDMNMGCVGLTERAARAAGYDVQCLWSGFGDKPEYYPEARGMVLKMIYDGATNRLLGLQAAGDGDILRRVDVFSAMLGRGCAVDDLLDLEHGYAPPYSEAMDPLHHLASLAAAKRRGLSLLPPCTASAGYGDFLDQDAMVWLDVREDSQFAEKRIPQYDTGRVLHIPIGQLRARIGELDRDAEYVIMCGRGSRSYQAWCILHSAGFTRVHVAGAGNAGAGL
ncbi:MAG: FAD-dependent oxidoreductase [Spirochaetes bacterium]|nr:FAD-dependent oxidoreductase [Spirochaetota bacterium]